MLPPINLDVNFAEIGDKMDNYFTILVNATLLQEWKNTPLKAPQRECNVALDVFAKIALKAAKEETPVASANYKTDLSEKVKEFVKKHASIIRRELQSGYPFSLVEKNNLEAFMQHTLKTRASLLASHFQLSDRWIPEIELNETFNTISPEAFAPIPHTCSLLMEAYKKGDLKAGYYFLWLIKHKGGCDFTIPGKGEFTPSTVPRIVSELIVKRGVCTRPYHLIDILFSGTQEPVFKILLATEGEKRSFYTFTSLYLATIHCESWPNKTTIIPILLSQLDKESQSALAASLASNPNPVTKQIGAHLVSALQAPTLHQAIPHFNALKDLFHLPLSKIGKIFDKPLFAIVTKESHSFCKQLIFNVKEQVILHQDLIIGLYAEENFLYMLAFNRETEQIAWCTPLPENKAPQIKLIENRIAVYDKGKDVQFFKLESGERGEKLKAGSDELYFQNGNRVCQKIGASLHIGKIADGNWSEYLELPHPGGVHKPHPTHLLFLSSDSILYIISPSGNKAKVRNCLDVAAKESKLYILEKREEKIFLSILSPTDDSTILSKPDKVIQIDCTSPTIGGFCGNNHLVLFEDRKKALLINFDTGKAYYYKQPIPLTAKIIIHPEGKGVWTWNSASKEVRKISPFGADIAGVLKQEGEIDFIDISAEGHLYFMG